MSFWDDLRCASCGLRRGEEVHWTEAECDAEWGRCPLGLGPGHHSFVSGEPRLTIVREMAGAWRKRGSPWGQQNPFTAKLYLDALRRVWHAARGA
jgi:hypothetical protein